MTAKLADAGVDYLRITSCSASAQSRMIDYFCDVARRDGQIGYEVKNGGCFGFYGKKTRHALLGDKDEWMLLQASGYEAKHALLLAHEGTQASRLDLQLTYQVGAENVQAVIRDAYNAACSTDRPEARHMKINLIESRGRAQTVYLGSRASDIFFRIYDKYEESGKEEHKGCVRFELELKGRASKALWQRLVTGEETLASCLAMVVKMLLDRGIVVPAPEIEPGDKNLPPREPTRPERTAAWLAGQVAPAVMRLTQERGWMYPFSMLFHLAMEDYDRKRVMRSLALNWGS